MVRKMNSNVTDLRLKLYHDLITKKVKVKDLLSKKLFVIAIVFCAFSLYLYWWHFQFVKENIILFILTNTLFFHGLLLLDFKKEIVEFNSNRDEVVEKFNEIEDEILKKYLANHLHERDYGYKYLYDYLKDQKVKSFKEKWL